MPGTVDLSLFDNRSGNNWETGRSLFVRAAWFWIGSPLLRSSLIPSSGFRRWLLRLFGAEVGPGVIIRPGVRVKFPWRLRIGTNCWIGEDCWIDNLAQITVGDHVCLSQAAYLCTGSHDWTDPAFRLIVRPIVIHSGAWVAARASIGPGTVVGTHAVAGFGAVVTRYIPPYEIHGGNPAQFLRLRDIKAFQDKQSYPPGRTTIAKVRHSSEPVT